MATDAYELHGRRALVTGGTKGIGHAIAARLRESGATVLTTARTTPDDSSGADFVAADVATADGCRTVVDAVHRRLGGIDIIAHVVGGSSAPAGGFAVLDDREWQRALDVSHHSHHIDSESAAVAGRHACVRGSEGSTGQLQ